MLFVLCSGCASTRPAATALASQGGTASRTIEAAFARTEADLDLLVDRRILQAALSGRDVPSPRAQRDIDRVQAAIGARRNLCGDLARLYDGFAALSAYDASAEVTSAFSDVSASANALAAAVGDSAVVSAPIADLATRLAAAATTSLQNGRLRKTSAVIREQLVLIRGLIEKETPLYASVRQELERVTLATSRELYRSGIGRPHPLLRELLDTREFAYDERQANATLERGPRSAAIDSAIFMIVQRRIARRLELERTLVSAFASVLTQLELEHQAFEANRPLDTRAVGERVAAFRQMVDLLNELRRGRSELPESQP
jgi:hypothetical protein